MARKKKVENDQAEIILLLKKKKYNHVWELVKFIGYKEEPEVNRRYLIFKKACEDFNPDKNNNFILFFKNYIKYLDFNKDKTFYTTTNYTFIKQLKNENISPTEDVHPMVEQLKHINP